MVVFGGDHAEKPLEVDARWVLAPALVEQSFSVIFDVVLMLTDDQIHFTSDFANELLRINRTALRLIYIWMRRIHSRRRCSKTVSRNSAWER